MISRRASLVSDQWCFLIWTGKSAQFFGAMTGERITMLATKVICFSSMFRLTSMNVNKLHFCLYHKYFLIEFLATID